MKKRDSILYAILFGLLMVFLFAFMLQERLHLFEMKPLAGFIKKTEMPTLTMESYQSGQYQAQLEDHLGETFGFREPVIRIYNQYLWSCYRKTYCHFIVPGKKGYLFYKEATNDYIGRESLNHFLTNENAKTRAEKNVRMMRKLRYVLQDYGIEFLCFMAPSKTQVYSEYLPTQIRDNKADFNTAEYYDSLMTAYDFPHIEMTRWYQMLKDTTSVPLFPKRDSHWRHASVYGYDSLFSYMNSLNDFGIPDIHVQAMQVLDTAYAENDEQTLNLLFRIPNDSPKYRAQVTVDAGHKPKVLFVGDSFVWDLEDYTPWKEILEDVEIWFYNENAFIGFPKEKHPIGEINRLRSILNKDFVLWYSSGSQWCRATYGFVEDALLQLCVSDSLFNAQIPWVMDSLRNDSAYKELRWRERQTEQYAEVLRQDAIKALKNDPELIPGLRGEAMPTIRNTEAIALAQQANRIAADKQWLTSLRVAASQANRPLDEVLDEEAENIVFGRALLRDAVQVDTASVVQMEVEKLINHWRNDPQMMQFLENKAKENGKSFEEVLEGDAKWVVNERLRNGELF